jgi:hypothetical protein
MLQFSIELGPLSVYLGHQQLGISAFGLEHHSQFFDDVLTLREFGESSSQSELCLLFVLEQQLYHFRQLSILLSELLVELVLFRQFFVLLPEGLLEELYLLFLAAELLEEELLGVGSPALTVTVVGRVLALLREGPATVHRFEYQQQRVLSLIQYAIPVQRHERGPALPRPGGDQAHLKPRSLLH